MMCDQDNVRAFTSHHVLSLADSDYLVPHALLDPPASIQLLQAYSFLLMRAKCSSTTDAAVQLLTLVFGCRTMC